ncbi:MAG: hypothetical protein ACTSQ5_03390 [Promethearchaeota archaeon]
MRFEFRICSYSILDENFSAKKMSMMPMQDDMMSMLMMGTA